MTPMNPATPIAAGDGPSPHAAIWSTDTDFRQAAWGSSLWAAGAEF